VKILIDTREQNPLEFKDVRYPYVTDTVRMTLGVGDYGCQYEDGWVAPVVFERKSIPDLFGTLGKGHERFKKEIARSKRDNIKLILIIEGSFSKVMKGYGRSSLKGTSVIKTIMTFWVKYNLIPVFCKDRTEMKDYIYNYFCAIGRLKVREK